MEEQLDLMAIQERFMMYQRARNHSPKQLTHYAITFCHSSRYSAR